MLDRQGAQCRGEVGVDARRVGAAPVTDDRLAVIAAGDRAKSVVLQLENPFGIGKRTLSNFREHRLYFSRVESPADCRKRAQLLANAIDRAGRTCSAGVSIFRGAPGRPLVQEVFHEHRYVIIARMSARQALDRRGLATKLVIAQQQTPTEVFTF